MTRVDSDFGDSPTLGVFGLFVLALGTALVTTVMWAPSLRRVSASAGWPSVTGAVVASGVYPHGKHSPIGDTIADVEYTVNGARLESFAQEVAFDIPVGSSRPTLRSPIAVWYDPGDPSRCTLINTWQTRHTWRLWWILGPWAFVGVTLPVLGYRFYKATQGELILDD